jgi:hypothetical protein
MENLKFSDSLASAIADEIAKNSSESERRSQEMTQTANAQTEEVIEDLQQVEKRLRDSTLLLDNAKKEKQELSKQLEANNKAHDSIVIELRKQIEAKAVESKELTTTNESLRKEVTRAELKLEGNQEYVEEVKSQNLELITENKSLSKEISANIKTISTQEAVISGNEKLISNQEITQADLKETLVKSEQERSSLSNTNNAIRNDLDIANKTISTTNERLNTEIKHFTEIKIDMDKQAKSLNQTIDSQQTVISGNEKLISNYEQTQAELKTNITSAEKNVSALTKTVSNHEEAKVTLENSLVQSEEKYSSLTIKLKAANETISEQKTKLKDQ